MPPVGELRWKAPVPASAWTGIRDATEFGSACPQTGAGDEDCLFLNVYAPEPPQAKPRPVMVWIHGGAFILGSGDIYDGSVLAGDNGVVVLTLNYRLGELGFFALPDLAAEDARGAFGNYAISDQLLALEWVQENIEAFGGNPNEPACVRSWRRPIVQGCSTRPSTRAGHATAWARAVPRPSSAQPT
jgi:para-nitrobenzyl esterase